MSDLILDYSNNTNDAKYDLDMFRTECRAIFANLKKNPILENLISKETLQKIQDRIELLKDITSKKRLDRIQNRFQRNQGFLFYYRGADVGLKEVTWIPVLTQPIVIGDYKIIEFTNREELFDHGVQMRHCIGIYLEPCMRVKKNYHPMGMFHADPKKGTDPIGSAIYEEIFTHGQSPKFRALKAVGERNIMLSDEQLKSFSDLTEILEKDAFAGSYNASKAEKHRFKQYQEFETYEKKNPLAQAKILLNLWDVLNRIWPGIPHLKEIEWPSLDTEWQRMEKN